MRAWRRERGQDALAPRGPPPRRKARSFGGKVFCLPCVPTGAFPIRPSRKPGPLPVAGPVQDIPMVVWDEMYVCVGMHFPDADKRAFLRCGLRHSSAPCGAGEPS